MRSTLTLLIIGKQSILKNKRVNKMGCFFYPRYKSVKSMTLQLDQGEMDKLGTSTHQAYLLCFK